MKYGYELPTALLYKKLHPNRFICLGVTMPQTYIQIHALNLSLCLGRGRGLKSNERQRFCTTYLSESEALRPIDYLKLVSNF